MTHKQYAFSDLCVRIIDLITDVKHQYSWMLAERCGFKLHKIEKMYAPIRSVKCEPLVLFGKEVGA